MRKWIRVSKISKIALIMSAVAIQNLKKELNLKIVENNYPNESKVLLHKTEVN